MPKGGYTVLNLKGSNITNSPVTIPGIYERLESSTKAVLVENFSVNGIEQSSFFAARVAADTSFTLFRNTTATGVAYIFRVTNEDKIFTQTYNPAAPVAG